MRGFNPKNRQKHQPPYTDLGAHLHFSRILFWSFFLLSFFSAFFGLPPCSFFSFLIFSCPSNSSNSFIIFVWVFSVFFVFSNSVARATRLSCAALHKLETKLAHDHHDEGQRQPFSDHFWTLRCRKNARRCGAKHISK